MSYINQDPDIVTDPRLLVPHKGKHVVSVTKSAWLVDQARDEGLSFSQAEASSCWCGACPGSCVDCQEADVVVALAATTPRINVASGEDATWSMV